MPTTAPTLGLMNVLKARMKISLFLLLFFVCSFSAFSQQETAGFSVLFYNVENLFDLDDDPLTRDDEFTPGGDRHWTYNRLNSKLNNISRVILSASGWETPALVALCEVENRKVIDLLNDKTPLKSVPFKVIHKESPDPRGIDVALLYRAERFYPLEYEYFPVKRSSGSAMRSREILYVSGVVDGADTLHVFVNHWPSRYSGLLETKPLRRDAALTLREKIDELQKKYRAPKIIITGDFNDNPNDESLLVHLKAGKLNGEPGDEKLYNLSLQWTVEGPGTTKYRSQWSVFDQVIVSGSLLNAQKGAFTIPQWGTIVTLPFLFERDERYGGQKPFRTYNGYRYNGGFSDHFPVLLKLDLR